MAVMTDYVTDVNPRYVDCGIEFDIYRGELHFTYSGTSVIVLACIEWQDPIMKLWWEEEIDIQYGHWPTLAEIISDINWKMEP